MLKYGEIASTDDNIIKTYHWLQCGIGVFRSLASTLYYLMVVQSNQIKAGSNVLLITSKQNSTSIVIGTIDSEGFNQNVLIGGSN